MNLAKMREIKLLIAGFTALICVSGILTLPLTGSSRRTSYRDMMGRIVGGQKASPGQFPWEAALILKEEIYTRYCGGVILSDEWILTAGICVQYQPEARVQVGSVTLGDHDTNRQTSVTPLTFAHEDFYQHSQYSDNDIGLVHLTTKIELNEFVQPILLPENDVATGDVVTVSGWGTTSDGQIGEFSNSLYYADFTAIDLDDCRDIFENQDIPDSFVCLQGQNKEGSCQGDNGNGAVRYEGDTPVLIGTISFRNYLSCEEGSPIGANKVFKYREWIREQTGI